MHILPFWSQTRGATNFQIPQKTKQYKAPFTGKREKELHNVQVF